MNNPKTFQLTAAERAALIDFAATYKKARPNVSRTAAMAKRIHRELINAPMLGIGDTPKPSGFSEQPPPPEIWTVGHAQVNYVDHIDVGTTETGQDND